MSTRCRVLKMNDSSSTLDSMSTLEDYLLADGWELLEPLLRDGGYLYRASKDNSVVQAATVSELCKRISYIERGLAKPPTFRADNSS